MDMEETYDEMAAAATPLLDGVGTTMVDADEGGRWQVEGDDARVSDGTSIERSKEVE